MSDEITTISRRPSVGHAPVFRDAEGVYYDMNEWNEYIFQQKARIAELEATVARLTARWLSSSEWYGRLRQTCLNGGSRPGLPGSRPCPWQ